MQGTLSDRSAKSEAKECKVRRRFGVENIQSNRQRYQPHAQKEDHAPRLKTSKHFSDCKGVIKIGDLGLGRYLSEATMEAFTKVGTPLYMSPERLNSKKAVVTHGKAIFIPLVVSCTN